MITRENPLALAINLRHLRALTVVAREGSIAAASESLCRGASAVTRAIGELERSIGRPLFERTRRGVVLNDDGHRVLVRAQRIEQEFATACEQLARGVEISAGADPQSALASVLNGRRLAVIARLVDKNMLSVAREFGLTQPALSGALKDMERGLGVELFERTTRGLVPTLSGETVAFYFKRVLAELRQIHPDITAGQGRLQGTVNVGALPLGRVQVLPEAIVALLARHPGLHVATLESPYESLSESLRNGDIDFLFGALRDSDQADGLIQEPIFQDSLSLIVRADHPLTKVDRIDFDSLQGARWVMPRREAPSRDLLERFFVAKGEQAPLPAVETGDLGILRGLLLRSDLLTAISAHLMRQEIESGLLVVLDYELPQTRRWIGISERPGSLASPGCRALIDEIRRVVAQSPLFESWPRPQHQPSTVALALRKGIEHEKVDSSVPF